MPLLSTFGAASARGFGGGLGPTVIDPVFGSVLADKTISNQTNAGLNVIPTNDNTKFLATWYNSSTKYYRGCVVTIAANGTISFGSVSNLTYNQYETDARNAGLIWDSASGAGIMMSYTSYGDVKPTRVTYSGTSISVATSGSTMYSTGNYNSPQPINAAPNLIYNSDDNVYFNLASQYNQLYVYPFTVSGSSFSYGTYRATGITSKYENAETVWVGGSLDKLISASTGYSSGSGQYWNTYGVSGYSGGTDGTWTNHTAGSNYNGTGTSNTRPAVLYHPENNQVFLISRNSSGIRAMKVKVGTLTSTGISSFGSTFFMNESDPTTSPTTQYSAYYGGYYDPIAKAIIIAVQISQYSTKLFQIVTSGNDVSEIIEIGSMGNMSPLGEGGSQGANDYGYSASLVYDSVHDRQLLFYSKIYDPTAFVNYKLEVREVTGRIG
jgi:hypothetical protein